MVIRYLIKPNQSNIDIDLAVDLLKKLRDGFPTPQFQLHFTGHYLRKVIFLVTVL